MSVSRDVPWFTEIEIQFILIIHIQVAHPRITDLSYPPLPHLSLLTIISSGDRAAISATDYTATSTMASPIEITIAATGKKLMLSTGLFINNEFVPSVDSQEKIQWVTVVQIALCLDCVLIRM